MRKLDRWFSRCDTVRIELAHARHVIAALTAAAADLAELLAPGEVYHA